MRAASFRTWLALGCIVTAGCVSTLGLDHFTNVPCVGASCDEVEDASLPDVKPPDYFPEASGDVEPDTAIDDSSTDVTTDTSPVDAPVDDSSDAGADVDGCGDFTSPLNCTGCGIACDTVNSVGATCNGTKCSYAQCAPNHSDCDKSGVNTNGCECATPGCCPGSLCQTTHSTGTDASFYDCVPLGTITLTQAASACNAFTDGGTCLNLPCQGQGPNADHVVCTAVPDGSTCGCWSYEGGIAPGHVHVGNACACPPITDPTWN